MIIFNWLIDVYMQLQIRHTPLCPHDGTVVSLFVLLLRILAPNDIYSIHDEIPWCASHRVSKILTVEELDPIYSTIDFQSHFEGPGRFQSAVESFLELLLGQLCYRQVIPFVVEMDTSQREWMGLSSQMQQAFFLVEMALLGFGGFYWGGVRGRVPPSPPLRHAVT